LTLGKNSIYELSVIYTLLYHSLLSQLLCTRRVTSRVNIGLNIKRFSSLVIIKVIYLLWNFWIFSCSDNDDANNDYIVSNICVSSAKCWILFMLHTLLETVLYPLLLAVYTVCFLSSATMVDTVCVEFSTTVWIL